MKYESFIFKNYVLEGKTLTLTYSLDDAVTFKETYSFDFDFIHGIDQAALDRALQNLFLVAGVSYFKTYLPQNITIENAYVDNDIAIFLSKTYQKGLGEFFYVNQLDPRAKITFPVSHDGTLNMLSNGGEGLLIGLGGGKDSLVSVELLRNQSKVATWSLGHREQLQPLVDKIGLPHFWVERKWDKSLLDLNSSGAYNGHVPISAIFACVGTVVAILTGYRDVVVSNESSASEPNLEYQGVAINHQYSKSLEFEKDYQSFLEHTIGAQTRYYSFLRPLSELHIAELFARFGFEKYQGVFSSCNKAFIHTSEDIFWCGECPKCAFVFLAFTPFIDRGKLEALFHAKNLLLDPRLEQTYRQLLGIEGNKPLDCVGEVKESRSAMELAKKQYPELKKYMYELPENYDYRDLSEHTMPDELFTILRSSLSKFSNYIVPGR